MNLFLFFKRFINKHFAFTPVGAGLLSKIKINSSNVLSTEHLRPTLSVNQQSTTYARNTVASMIAEWAGLKYITTYCIDRINSYVSARPTPTLIGVYGGVM